jgi:uncharacterized RDD family membrane protein YckC
MTQQDETQQHGAAVSAEQATPAAPAQQATPAASAQQATPAAPVRRATPAAPVQQATPAGPAEPALAPARLETAGAGQQASPGQADAAQPSTPSQAAPSRYGYEGVPDAYLAPPQPGQPRYGTPLNPGGGRPFPGRPGYGQPAGAQPGYGRPGPARPGTGAAIRSDPTLAPPWQRLIAQTIDWIIIIVVSVIAFWSQLSMVWREVQAITGRYPDLTTPAAQAAINSVSRDPANQHALIYWFLGIFGLALAYYWVQHAAWGATLGKRAMGMRVVRAADRSRVGVLAAGIRTVAFLVGPAIFLLLAYPINVVGGLLWAADAGLPVLEPRAQSLHDKLAGTVVVRRRALDEQARRSSPW